MKNNVKVIYPAYVDEFKCIGGSCSDNCCIGWDIDIDKETFRKYHKIQDESMRKMFQKSVQNNPGCTNDKLDYGIIKLNKEGKCPFLDEDCYCTVQNKYGEDFLSSVCTQFPRVVNKIDDHYEMSIDLACPEAVRLVLMNEGKTKFIEGEKSLGKYTMAGILDTKDKEFKNTEIKYFKEIRDFSIKMIQDRKFDLGTRLYILGEFFSDLEDLIETDCSKIPHFVNDYDVEGAAAYFEREDMNYAIQVSILNDVIKLLNIEKESDEVKLKKYIKNALKGFELKENSNSPQVEKNINAFKNYNEEYMEKYSYIFENYMVNFMYNNLFPFSDSDYVFEGYMMLLLRYSLIRFCLVGNYIVNKEECADNIIEIIRVFVKNVEHDRNYRSDVLRYLKKNDYDNMEFAKILV